MLISKRFVTCNRKIRFLLATKFIRCLVYGGLQFPHFVDMSKNRCLLFSDELSSKQIRNVKKQLIFFSSRTIVKKEAMKQYNVPITFLVKTKSNVIIF